MGDSTLVILVYFERAIPVFFTARTRSGAHFHSGRLPPKQAVSVSVCIEMYDGSLAIEG